MRNKKKRKLDSLDLKILKKLTENARRPVSGLATQLNAPETTIHFRIKRLVSEGFIKNFTVNVSYADLGYPIEVLLYVKTHDYLVSAFEREREKELSKFISERFMLEAAHQTPDNRLLFHLHFSEEEFSNIKETLAESGIKDSEIVVIRSIAEYGNNASS